MATLEEKIASTIGDVSPDIVREVIESSNAEGYMFHGVKDDRLYNAVLGDGVKPLTPEGGYASFWTSGHRLFSHGKYVLRTYDTSFFHYAHSGHTEKGRSSMTLAIAKQSDLEEACLVNCSFEQDGYIKIPRRVPRELLHIIRIEIEYVGGKGTARQRAQEKERVLLYALHEVLTTGYEPGGLTVVKGRF